MKKNLEASKYTAFTGVITEMFGTTLDSMFEADAAVSLSEAFAGDADEIMSGYEEQVVVLATEEKSGFDAGIFFKTKDITMMASLMLMMESEGSEELEDDDKDAVKELCSQMLASVTVPLDEKLGTKVAFKVDDVMKNENSALFQSESYFCADMSLTVGERESTMRFFMDEALLDMFDSGGDAGAADEPDFGEQFTFPDDDDDGGMPDFGGGGGDSMPGGQNMDMLLDIDVPVSVKMGSTKMFLKDILTLGSGNVIELDESADEAVELVVNNKVIARGEVVIVDGYFGFRIKEIVSRAERLKKLKD
ncbi:flagellar motor switch protein FliN [Limisalsivibrio acetivorans]|uniref:flagellar motor switch protein FliN n=1 Tax=Limisalsivibrio acetivorans TaxID=1304888 RepID=UPI0003B30224|nr:flagellar motor switch protein FliN [Limisalsivibrio acetivorans]